MILPDGSDPTPVPDNAWPRPGQWIHRWNAESVEGRLLMAEQAIDAAQLAYGLRYGAQAHMLHELIMRQQAYIDSLKALVVAIGGRSVESDG